MEDYKKQFEKEFDNKFEINDGILEIWKRILPDGDWDLGTATLKEVKKFMWDFIIKYGILLMLEMILAKSDPKKFQIK